MKFNQFLPLKISLACMLGLLSINSHAQTTLRYSDHEPLGNMRTQFLNQVLFPAIEAESHGQLKIDAHWNGEKSTSYNALKTIQQGDTVDMGVVVPEYSAKELPRHQLFKSFPKGPTGQRQVAFFRQVYRDVPSLNEELHTQHIEPIFLATGYPVAFFGTQPLRSLDDIQGQTWRTASFWHRDFITNTGGKPVTMPWNDGINKALQDKTLQGSMVNIDSGYDLKTHQIAPYVSTSKDLWLGHLYIIAMNQNAWQKLSNEDKQAIQRASEKAYEVLGSWMDMSYTQQITQLRQAGAIVKMIPANDLNRWTKRTRYSAIQDKWVSEQEKNGIGVKTTLQQIRQVMQDYQ